MLVFHFQQFQQWSAWLIKQNRPLCKFLFIKSPDALVKFLFVRKILSSIPWDKCARWFLDQPNFVKAYQTSKTPSSCLGAGQIFVRRENCQIFQFTRHDWKKNVNHENLISIFSRSIEVRSPLKLFLEPERCSRTKRSVHWHSRSSNCFCWS